MAYSQANAYSLELDQIQVRATRYMSDVYIRMLLAVAASAGIAYMSIQSGLLLWGLQNLGRWFSLAIFGTQLLTVIAFQGAVFRMKGTAAQALFAVYAAVTGLTLGMVGLIYRLDSIVTVGLISACGFAGLAAYGKLTKRDLGFVGTFCIMGLTMMLVYALGIFVAGFFPAFQAYAEGAIRFQSAIGCLLFAGLTAYEAQRLKRIAFSLAKESSSDSEIEAYVNSGALTMYMNFIGLFLNLMRLMGNRR